MPAMLIRPTAGATSRDQQRSEPGNLVVTLRLVSKQGDQHGGAIHQGVRNSERDQPAKSQIQERFENR